MFIGLVEKVALEQDSKERMELASNDLWEKWSKQKEQPAYALQRMLSKAKAILGRLSSSVG